MDVWGLTRVQSLHGSCYYVTCIDDATRKTWFYLIIHKYDVFSTFKKWKVLVENKIGKRLKCLKSNNGGKYYIKYFDSYYSYCGICIDKTVPGTP